MDPCLAMQGGFGVAQMVSTGTTAIGSTAINGNEHWLSNRTILHRLGGWDIPFVAPEWHADPRRVADGVVSFWPSERWTSQHRHSRGAIGRELIDEIVEVAELGGRAHKHKDRRYRVSHNRVSKRRAARPLLYLGQWRPTSADKTCVNLPRKPRRRWEWGVPLIALINSPELLSFEHRLSAAFVRVAQQQQPACHPVGRERSSVSFGVPLGLLNRRRRYLYSHPNGFFFLPRP